MMKDYLDKVCPFCKTPFTEGDEVVVCSACEMPHHKDCWIANKGCTTFGCQGTIQGLDIQEETNISSAPKYEIRDDPTLFVEPIRCSRCGEEILPGNLFCRKCGTPVTASGKKNALDQTQKYVHGISSAVAQKWNKFLDRYKTDAPIDSDMEMFIGSQKEYYIKAFEEMRKNDKKYVWNWAACLLSPLWFMYRKMYIPGAAIAVACVVLALLSNVLAVMLGIIIAVVSGFYADYYYLYDLSKRIEKHKATPAQQKNAYFKKWSDVDTLIPSVAAVVMVLCVALF